MAPRNRWKIGDTVMIDLPWSGLVPARLVDWKNGNDPSADLCQVEVIATGSRPWADPYQIKGNA